MSQNAQTAAARSTSDRTPPANRGHDDLDGDGISLAELFHRIYKFFISKRTGLTLILAMGFFSLAGTLLEQAPDRVRSDPQAYASWLESVRPKYGGWTNLLNMAGMFEVFSSIWFKTTAVMLAISILACTYDRTPKLWKRARHPRVHVSESFFTHAGLRAHTTVALPPDEAIKRIRAELKARRYRTIDDPKGPGLNLYADRFRFGPLGTAVSHIAFVVILLGVLISATTGFKNPELAVAVGSRAEVGHGTGLAVEAKSFSDTYYQNGSPKDYVSELVLYQGDKQVATQKVRVNEPLRWEGVSFYQSYHGVAADMRVTNSGGEVLFASGVPLQWTSDDDRNSIGKFQLPDQKLTVYVVGAASGQVDPDISAGQMQLEIYQDDEEQPIATEVVTQGTATTIAGLSYTFERERKFTGLLVSRDPGAVWVYAGSTLIVLGLLSVFIFRHRRIWVRVRSTADGSAVLVACAERSDSGFESSFRQFVDVVTLAGKPGERREKVGQDA